jgi:hypothetical protein
MSEQLKQDLIDKVVNQIQSDIYHGDTEALSELLEFVPLKNLIYYLREDEWSIFENLK